MTPRPLLAGSRSTVLVASLLALLAGGCTDAEPTGAGRSVALDLRPTFAIAPASFASDPIDHVSLRAIETETSTVVGSANIAVDPNADEWVLTFAVDIGDAESLTIVVEFELLTGTTVEWSGRTNPFLVQAGTPAQARSVEVFRGPLDNLDVASVAIVGAPSQMAVGASVGVSAQVTLAPGSDVSPSVFWLSTDTTVATVTPEGSTATITALATGTVDIVAGAGSAMDTVSIEVLVQPSIIDPGLGLLVAIAYDPLSRNLFVYDDFATTIHEYTRVGTEVLPAIPSPAPTSNDFDLDFMSTSGTVGTTQVPANTLLVINGEVAPGVLFAVDKDDGTVLDSIALPAGNPVGGAFHPARGTLFIVEWQTDLITEVELDTGAALASFPVAPAGSPAFDVNYGDMAVDPTTGNLLVVSNQQNTIRVLTPTGAFVRDIDVGALGVSSMSGIGWDAQNVTAWIASTTGGIYRIPDIDATTPTSRSTLNPPGATPWEARTSQTRTGDAPVFMYDDFTFTAGATLQAVAWQGIYCRDVDNAPAPVPAASSFTVSFYADLGGEPDTTASVYSETIPVAEVAETLDQTGPASCGVTTSTTWGLYDYSATLSTPFNAAAATRYWVSVVANLPSTDLFWGWRGGTPDNDDSRQLAGGQFTMFARDRAFALGP